MARNIEEPVTVQSDHGTETTHPAFGQIRASRVSGSSMLYGSDFRHDAYVTITLSRSSLHRHLYEDRHYGGKELFRVALSEAQWATFVSAMNVGSGVPCTIERLPDGGLVPGLPAPKSRTDQYAGEMKAKLDGMIASVMKAIDEIDSLGLPKSKAAAAKESLNRIVTELRSDLPFVAEQFGEHMETTVEKAKSEIHGYMVHAVQAAGLEAITGGALPLQIEDQRSDAPNSSESDPLTEHLGAPVSR